MDLSLSKLGVGDGQGGLACCDSWGRKEPDRTERLNWTELIGVSLLKILRNLCVGKKQQLEHYMEQQTGSTLGKEYVKAVYCHPAFLTCMQITSCNRPGRMKRSWNQDCQEKYQQPQRRRWYHSKGGKWRGTREPFDEGERGAWKSWLKI